MANILPSNPLAASSRAAPAPAARALTAAAAVAATLATLNVIRAGVLQGVRPAFRAQNFQHQNRDDHSQPTMAHKSSSAAMRMSNVWGQQAGVRAVSAQGLGLKLARQFSSAAATATAAAAAAPMTASIASPANATRIPYTNVLAAVDTSEDANFPSPTLPTAEHKARLRAIGVNFTDTKEAYKSKTTRQLIYGLIIFSLCRFKPLVNNAEMLLRVARRVLGDRIVTELVRYTFFNYFCAGEDSESIRPTIEHIRKYNVGGILDFAAEADVDPATSTHGGVAGAKAKPMYGTTGRYTEEEEARCEQHLKIFQSSIQAVHNVTPEGFAAIKVTALCAPVLIQRLSSLIVALRSTFGISVSNRNKTVSRQAFRQSYRAVFDVERLHGKPGTPEVEALIDASADALFDRMDVDQSGELDLFEWTCTHSLQDIVELAANARPGTPLAECALDEEDKQALAALYKRMSILAEMAKNLGVRMMVDAEQTYFQPAIDLLVLELQRKYNKVPVKETAPGAGWPSDVVGKYAVVWNTYQCYLKDSFGRIKDDMHRSENEGWVWAAKLVRGAYMVQENRLAAEQNRPSPVWPDIESTHNNYNRCLEYVLTKLHRARVLIASHNQASAERAVLKMHELHIDPATGGVYFGQLFGMSDHLTFTLGQKGYKAYKYVPYGPVLEVIPYLIRRAQENSNIMGGASTEIQLIKKELNNRFGF